MDELTVYAWPKANNAKKNPYNKILYEGMSSSVLVKEFNWKEIKKDARCNILHLHWPDHMLRLKNPWRIRLRIYRFASMVDRLKKSGVKIVWTVHNLEPHECHHKSLMMSGMKKINSVVDGFIFLSEASKQEYISKYEVVNTKKHIVIPHLHYKNYFKESNKNTAIQEIIKKPKDIQLLCFGVIREHKGYEKLFQLAMNIAEKEKVGWIIAGNPGKSGVTEVLSGLIKKNNIVYSALRHVEDNEIPNLFAAADAVVLPYENILNSGTAILALSLNRKVIAPAIGSLVELQRVVGADWLYLYTAPLTIESLNDALQWVKLPTDSGMPMLDLMKPEIVAKETSDFYYDLLNL